MDGVIVDSEPIHMACEREIFRLMGITVPNEEHHKMVGANDNYMWSHMNRLYNLPVTVDEVVNLKKSLYMEYLKREVYLQPIPYVLELIIDLFANNISMGLASSSPHEQIDYILNKFELKGKAFSSSLSIHSKTKAFISFRLSFLGELFINFTTPKKTSLLTLLKSSSKLRE